MHCHWLRFQPSGVMSWVESFNVGVDSVSCSIDGRSGNLWLTRRVPCSMYCCQAGLVILDEFCCIPFPSIPTCLFSEDGSTYTGMIKDGKRHGGLLSRPQVLKKPLEWHGHCNSKDMECGSPRIASMKDNGRLESAVCKKMWGFKSVGTSHPNRRPRKSMVFVWISLDHFACLDITLTW